jgi:hypothetical protein
MRYQVLTAVSMKMSLIALMMEAVNTSETLVNFYETTLRNIPEDSHLHTRVVSYTMFAQSQTKSLGKCAP